MHKARPSIVSRSIRIAALVAIVLLFVRWVASRGFHWEQFRQTFAEADAGMLVLAASLSVLSYFIRALRWRAMVLPQKRDARIWPVLRDTIIGFAAAVVLGRAGEFIRPWLISKSLGVSFLSQAAVWVLERLMDLIAVLLFFGVALVELGPGAAPNAGPEIRWVLDSGGRLIVLGGAVALALLYLLRGFSPSSAEQWASRLSRRSARLGARMRGFLESFALGMAAARERAIFLLVFLFTIAEWLTLAACFWAVLRAFPPARDFPAWDAVVLLGFASIGSTVQVPGVGGGTQLMSILVLTQLYGLGMEPATAIATVLWLITFAIAVPPGIALAIHSGVRWRDFRERQTASDVTSEKL